MSTLPEIDSLYTTSHHGQLKVVTVMAMRSRNTKVQVRELDRQDSYTVTLKEFTRHYTPQTA